MSLALMRQKVRQTDNDTDFTLHECRSWGREGETLNQVPETHIKGMALISRYH